MRRQRQRGSAVEAVPVLLIALLVAVGAVQLSFFMAGRVSSDLAAYRASRMMQEGRRHGKAARHEAEHCCRRLYPEKLSRAKTEVNGTSEKVRVEHEMKPLLPLIAVSDESPFSTMKVQAQYPPKLENAKTGRRRW